MFANCLVNSYGTEVDGTEVEIQLPLKSFPDSSVSFLVGVRKGIPPPKTHFNIPMDRQLPDGD